MSGGLFMRSGTSLLQQDKTWIVIPAVFTYLHHYRQDLLTPFLGQNDYQGKFSWGNNTPMVLPLNDGFFRWTPTQDVVLLHRLAQLFPVVSI